MLRCEIWHIFLAMGPKVKYLLRLSYLLSHTNFLVKLQSLVFELFLSANLVLECSQQNFFFSKKISQMKAGQYKIHSTNPLVPSL